jgi:hypothetical protein
MKPATLREVTLLAASSVDLDNTQLALLLSLRGIGYGAVKLFCSARPSRCVSDIEYVPVPAMDLMGYNRFILNELHKHVATPFCLIVQADGFVLHPECWRPQFLEYDYVGAPWPLQLQLHPGNRFLSLGRNRVGNGGFSLRSRKLLEATASIDVDALDIPVKSEDMVICHFLYESMTAKGIRFAPVDLAGHFSSELLATPGGEPAFGFHGKALRSSLFHQPAFRQAVAAVCKRFDLSVPAELGNVGRNDPCPCGSGRKYKRCHGQGP